jgi:hypothetical protein
MQGRNIFLQEIDKKKTISKNIYPLPKKPTHKLFKSCSKDVSNIVVW